MTKIDQRSDETKNNILTAAKELFADRGYDTVTMRQIAKKAGCSHTTIYIYFKDKEALLHQLSMPSLLKLQKQMEQIAQHDALTPEDRLKQISHKFIHFCLQNKNMYTIIIAAQSTKIDEKDPKLEINKLRNNMFALLMRVIQDCLSLPKNEQLLTFTRIFFYNLHGTVSTYTYSNESVEELMNRLSSTFDEAVDVLLFGFKEKINQGADEK
ncbi:TetR/AcrR family transcriptional regulator [Bacillus gobiensis]|uniref:TetR/AcrR family transcriptional regulator n=1 Tax=Bacillus gobiensis TaxID=1441095 RepID=UPI003D192A23